MCDEEFNDRAYYDMSPTLEDWKARAEKAEAKLREIADYIHDAHKFGNLSDYDKTAIQDLLDD